MASRKSAFNSPEMQAELAKVPIKGVTYDQLMNRAIRRPWFGPYREVLAEFTDTFHTIITDTDADCDALLKRTQETCQEILDDYYW
jgi:sn-glycerol 3-phosphate transport system substrate-binding protein